MRVSRTTIRGRKKRSDRLIQTVIEGTNAKSGILDPLGADWESGADLYFNLLGNLAKNLKQCLS